MSAAGDGICGDGMGADTRVVVGTRIGAGTAAETFCLLWMLLERGIARCFSLAGLLRMIVRGDELERDWRTEGDDESMYSEWMEMNVSSLGC
jgi:hypothetical protein